MPGFPSTGDPRPVLGPGDIPDIPQAMNTAFYRMGPPNIIPVGPASQNDQFPVARPVDAMSFEFTNPNPFMVHLVGTLRPKSGDPQFVVATPQNGWWIPPGKWGPYGTVDPVLISAFAADFPLWSRPEFGNLGKAGTGVLILQYGNGR